MVDPSVERFNAAVEWVRSEGGFWHQNLERRKDDNGVYGIFANGDIKPGEILCRIPNKCGLFHNTWESPDTWNLKLKLTYSILCEMRKVAKGQESKFKHVLDGMTTLQEYKSHHPYFIPKIEHDLLDGYSPIFNMLRQGLDSGLEETKKRIKEFDTEGFTDDQIVIAYMNNNTRSWFGMYLPVMDMFNNSIRKGVINQTMEDESLVKSKVPYKPGEQVYISYGNKDMLVMAYEYGFYDETDYPMALPLVLNYTGAEPLNFAVARLCIGEGMTGILSDNSQRITVGIEDLGKMQRLNKLVCFSREGISSDLYKFFELFAIENYEELEAKKGKKKQVMKLLDEHLSRMIGGDAQYDKDERRSNTYLMLIKCLEDRIQILRDCRAWVREQSEKSE